MHEHIHTFSGIIMVDKSAAQKAMNAANVDFKAKNFSGALEKYSEAIKLDPEESTYPSNRANVHLKLKQWKDAEADATTALRMKPNHAKVSDIFTKYFQTQQ